MPDRFHILKILSKYYNQVPEEELLTLITRYFRKEHFSKRESIFMNGEGNTRHYFVEKGLLRLFVIDSSGKEFNILFAREGQVIGDLGTPRPTMYNLDAVEDTELYSVCDEGLRELFRLYNRYTDEPGTSMIIRSYIFLQQRFVAILTKTAEENYSELMGNDPELLRRLPQYHVASYLGVSAEFLSKIIARTVRK